MTRIPGRSMKPRNFLLRLRGQRVPSSSAGSAINLLWVLATIPVAIAGLSSPALAQSVDVMLNDCANVGQTFYRDFEARTDMRYNGQRTDGTHAIGGRIFLETRFADFTCSFDRSGRRMTEFFADGRSQPGFLPGAAGPAPGSGLAQVANVPANDVLNMRSGPGPGYPITGALSNGTTVRLLQCSSGAGPRWCEIEMMTDMRERGWVNARYLSGASGAGMQLPEPPGSSAGGAVQLPEGPGATTGGEAMRVTGLATGGRLNIRSGPGTGYSIVGSVRQGDLVRSLGCQGAGAAGWCRILVPASLGQSGWASARYLSPQGAAVQLPSSPPSGLSGTTTVRVRFPAGATGTRITETLLPNATRRYVLGARAGQLLTFGVPSGGGGVTWRITNPDSTLLDRASGDRGYRGELWQNGDHVIEVINQRTGSATYTIDVGIR
ncbi:SH3 domain-containing protein [Aquicoccus sp. SCR17]|nr:SH3 domain-containing protein [Carideicomes alvinocaridis]